MVAWTEDLLVGVSRCSDESSLSEQVRKAARALGFDHFAYGLRMPTPVTEPKVFMASNYPSRWRSRYDEAGYLKTDPSVLHGRRSRAPVMWSDELFAQAPDLWAEARAFGLRVGWAQSSIDGHGVVGMLTLSRSGQLLNASELRAKESQMRWLVDVSHIAFSRILTPKFNPSPEIPLTERELEILKWLADGKTSRDTAEILRLSIDTVNFHVRNAIFKLRAANKTAAAVRAVMLGLFD